MSPPRAVLGLWLMILALQVLLVVALTGSVTYSLDDAYIHLALAEGLREGHHGINPGEFSAPSSSILWPYLLAPLMGGPLELWWPLILNLAAGVGLVGLIGPLQARVGEGAPSWLGAFLLISFNICALPLMGMEHSLQLFLAVLTTLGLWQALEERQVPWWLWLGLCFGPLVRYEHLGLTVPALALLGLRLPRARLGALGVVFGVTLGIAASALSLFRLGLGYLPSSILVKSAVVGSGGRLGTLAHNVALHTLDLQGVLVLLAVPALAVLAWRRRGWERDLAGFGLAAALGHLVAGHSGWYTRYTAYIWATLLVVGLALLRAELPRVWRLARDEPRALRLAGLIVLLLHSPQLWAMFSTPLAALNIFEQQRQIHVFSSEALKGGVAVNDIGYAAWKNDYYILDLVGLGSLEALAHRGAWAGPEWMDELAEKKDARAAVIYEHIAPSLPSDWVRLASLSLSGPRITSASETIWFYATSPQHVPEVSAALDALSGLLPPRLSLERVPTAPG